MLPPFRTTIASPVYRQSVGPAQTVLWGPMAVSLQASAPVNVPYFPGICDKVLSQLQLVEVGCLLLLLNLIREAVAPFAHDTQVPGPFSRIGIRAWW